MNKELLDKVITEAGKIAKLYCPHCNGETPESHCQCGLLGRTVIVGAEFAFSLQPPAQGQAVDPRDMTVEEFYSGFNLSFLTPEEQQTIYTATELFAKGKVRMAKVDAEGWISVEDGLPEDGKLVLIFSKTVSPAMYDKGRNEFGRYPNHTEGDRCTAYVFTHVTHWRKLPNPPQV